MSDVHTTINLSTHVGQCTDPNAKRYALGNVLAIPDVEPERVILVATDAKSLSITMHSGCASAPQMLPAKPFAKPGKIEVNGRCERISSRGKVECVEPINHQPGLFPRIQDAIPEPNCNWITLRIDAELLCRLAKSLVLPDKENGSALPVTLHMEINRDNCIEDSIAVHGTAGIGVLMPFESAEEFRPGAFSEAADRLRPILKNGITAVNEITA